MDDRPRGVRNNNPGNIDYDPRVPWVGQLGLELLPKGETPRFARFDNPEHGIRALCKILIAYQVYHSLWCILDMTKRWAPLGDGNNPVAYAETVVATLNAELNPARPFTITMPISVHEPLYLGAIAKGFIKVECSGYEYRPEILYAGVQLAEPGAQ